MLLSFCQYPQAKDHRGSLAVTQVELTTPYRRECTPGFLDSSYSISIRGCQKGLIRGFGLWLGDLGGIFRKQDFALDWMLSRSGGDFMIGYLNNSYLEGKLEQGKKYTWKEAAVTHNSHNRGIFCDFVVGQCSGK